MSLHYQLNFILKLPVLLLIALLSSALVYSLATAKTPPGNSIALGAVVALLFLLVFLCELKFKRIYVKGNNIIVRDLFFRITVLHKDDVRLERAHIRFHFFDRMGLHNYKLVDGSGEEYPFNVNTWEFTENKLRKTIFG